jgi:glycosyltransferase involved in cell wall biosynthesis
MNRAIASPRLTIAIPTYDRNAILERGVRVLVPQLRPQVRLVIRDNASQTAVSQTLGPLLEDDASRHVQVIRNRENIGGNANILRCLEECETEWIWILGDDDEPAPDAVDRILADVENAAPRLLCVNYRCELYDRRAAIDLVGRDDFIERVDSISNLLYLSAGVFRTAPLLRQIRMAYAYAYSNMPHLIALILALGEDGRVRLSMDRIASWNPGDFRQAWSVVNAALAFPTLLDLPFSRKHRRVLARKLESDVHPELLGLARQLLQAAVRDGDTADARWTWKQIRSRRYAGMGWSAHRALAWALAALFVAPYLTHPVVEFAARRLLGERARENVVQDRVARI